MKSKQTVRPLPLAMACVAWGAAQSLGAQTVQASDEGPLETVIVAS